MKFRIGRNTSDLFTTELQQVANFLSSLAAAAGWRGGEGCSLPATHQNGRSTVSNVSGNSWDLFIHILRVFENFTLQWARRSAPPFWDRLDWPHCSYRRWTTRLRGGDELWETDMLCWELTILPSHQCCATSRFKEHVRLVVKTSFNQGWYHMGSNRRGWSPAPDGSSADRIRQIPAHACCGSPLAPWWATCWQICLFMMPS